MPVQRRLSQNNLSNLKSHNDVHVFELLDTQTLCLGYLPLAFTIIKLVPKDSGSMEQPEADDSSRAHLASSHTAIDRFSNQYGYTVKYCRTSLNQSAAL